MIEMILFSLIIINILKTILKLLNLKQTLKNQKLMLIIIKNKIHNMFFDSLLIIMLILRVKLINHKLLNHKNHSMRLLSKLK